MSIFTLRSGGTAHPESSVLQQVTDLISVAGVFDANLTHFKVIAQAVPDLTVKVQIGRAFVKGTSTNAYPVRSDTDESVTVPPNSSGNPRIDAVILYIDLAATANAEATNVAKLIVVQGTPAASPVAPTDGEISTAIGSANPFLRLANVTVASGATSITNPNISDTRVTFNINTPTITVSEQAVSPPTPVSGKSIIYSKTDGKVYAKDDGGRERIMADEDWIDLTDGATINIDLSLGRKFRVTIAGNRILTVSNVTTGKTFLLRIKQDGVGNRTVSFFATIAFPNNVVPTLSTGANKADTFGFTAQTPTTFDGFTVGQNN